MKKIVFAAQKGGVGKSTAAANLGVELSNRGHKVVLLDVDPQAALADWWNDREAEQPEFAQVPLEHLEEALARLSKSGFDYAIIDMPGRAGELDELVLLADLAIIPTQPSPMDLRANAVTIALVEKHKVPFAFLVNKTKPRARLTGETMRLLAARGRIVPVSWGDREDHKLAWIVGKTAKEVDPKGKVAEEVDGLCDYVSEQFSAKVKKPARKQALD